METAKLEITKSQFETLIKLVFLGGVLANGDGGGIACPAEVEQYLYAKAMESGLDHLVTYNRAWGRYELRLNEALKLDSYLDKCLFALR